jgi:hypothetical protein
VRLPGNIAAGLVTQLVLKKNFEEKLTDSCELEIDFFMRLDIMRALYEKRGPSLKFDKQKQERD